ncbi:aminoacyl-histidine dipeptidase [Psychromonas sp. CNPT3]|uniref:aminoacyl-histidine dipeptidase n=1 Tax=Psychromonas sp. CNPT3 TaxID=314282 RepID=UPI00006E8092|nr:aminoacyl-histidine dipeptidase [Psychromonas sp. CNPT3]AGH80767.1 aminoacyl-histidine dipeptidase [Psychromonas sp. CNPT3]
MQSLQSTLAADVWSYFAIICSIPHPSKHEEKLKAWISAWAVDKNIDCREDEVGNLILRKPASTGFENRTPVILQAHLDMVPQKNTHIEHDFLVDPIKPIRKGEWLHADNTTLGADNGVGLASCLAVLADNSIQHGPLEVLLTVDEETTMAGAEGLQKGTLQGKILLNTDSEQEGELYVGCAGAININVSFDYTTAPCKAESQAFEISLDGLKGGHSGCDIHLQRANAILVLGELLNNIEGISWDLATLQGGSLCNAIARDAKAIIVCSENDEVALKTYLENKEKELTTQFKHSESGIALSLKKVALPDVALSSISKKNILDAIVQCLDGIYSMDKNFADVIQSSSNFGVLNQHHSKQFFEIEVLIRSQVETEKQILAEIIYQNFKKRGVDARKEQDYPGWMPNIDSAIYRLMEAQYIALFDKKPETMIIHAGLECGLFIENYPQLDMISFGPTINFPHSPDEKVNIASVDKYWQLLLATLKAIK